MMQSFLDTFNITAHNRADEIDHWIAREYGHHAVPIYSSVDIRHAGFKLAPVDTNLFPAGFNNLSEAGRLRAARALSACLRHYPQPVSRIVIVVESHTRNKPYMDNIAVLMQLCERAGAEIRIGRLDLQGDSTLDMQTTQDQRITAEAMRLQDGHIVTASGFVPDIVIINNDLSSGCPDILLHAAQPILPHPHMGWYRRRKSRHFDAYNQVARRFAEYMDIDSWLISTVIHHCGRINFKERKGMECVAIGVDKAVHAIKQKYAEYGITREPYVYIKADSGTYGMGIMTARSGDEVFELNKKTRNKMNIIKEGVANSEVIIQEGVPTRDTWNGAVAEPMMYLVGGQVVNACWRANKERDAESSLNAGGMTFTPFEEEAFARHAGLAVMARLATLASTYEEYDMQDDAA